MNSLETVKKQIVNLFRSNPNIHINVSMSSPKVCLNNEPVEITAVYPHIFQIEEKRSGSAKRYTVQYADVLTGQIQIAELSQL